VINREGANLFPSTQRVVAGLRQHGNVVPYFDQSKLGKGGDIALAHRGHPEPLALDIAQRPAQGDRAFEAEVGKGGSVIAHVSLKRSGVDSFRQSSSGIPWQRISGIAGRWENSVEPFDLRRRLMDWGWLGRGRE
jgi:hypothetical protein